METEKKNLRTLPPTDGTSFAQPHPQYPENQKLGQKSGPFSFLRSKKKGLMRKIARQMLGKGSSSHDSELKAALVRRSGKKGG